jgi:hypothetical protein
MASSHQSILLRGETLRTLTALGEIQGHRFILPTLTACSFRVPPPSLACSKPSIPSSIMIGHQAFRFPFSAITPMELRATAPSSSLREGQERKIAVFRLLSGESRRTYMMYRIPILPPFLCFTAKLLPRKAIERSKFTRSLRFFLPFQLSFLPAGRCP